MKTTAWWRWWGLCLALTMFSTGATAGTLTTADPRGMIQPVVDDYGNAGPSIRADDNVATGNSWLYDVVTDGTHADASRGGVMYFFYPPDASTAGTPFTLHFKAWWQSNTDGSNGVCMGVKLCAIQATKPYLLAAGTTCGTEVTQFLVNTTINGAGGFGVTQVEAFSGLGVGAGASHAAGTAVIAYVKRYKSAYCPGAPTEYSGELYVTTPGDLSY